MIMPGMTEQITDMARRRGRVSSADLAEIGASRTTLAYMAKKGILRRIARGVYVPADQISENETLQAASLAVPHGVVCLLSALQFHEITTQMPMETWIAVERNQAIPKSRDFSLRIVRLGKIYFECGIEAHRLQGSTVRVYCPAKTVVDCFKFRNKIGLDIAREALKDSLSQGKATLDEIHRYARICRMLTVMRPYLEMV
jgi:predicted transcriptional regulator of viral defense system